MTYSELQDTIASYLHRSDLTDEIVTFIELAEARIYRQLRSPEMEAFADVVFTTDSAPLPDRWVGMRAVRYDGARTPYALQSVGLHALARFQGAVGSGASPQVYAVQGTGISIAPVGDSVTVTLTYYQALEPLADVGTNLMLDNYPQLFLYGSLLEGAVFTQDQQLGVAYLDLFNAELARITQSNEWSRWGEAPQMSAIG